MTNLEFGYSSGLTLKLFRVKMLHNFRFLAPKDMKKHIWNCPGSPVNNSKNVWLDFNSKNVFEFKCSTTLVQKLCGFAKDFLFLGNLCELNFFLFMTGYISYDNIAAFSFLKKWPKSALGKKLLGWSHLFDIWLFNPFLDIFGFYFSQNETILIANFVNITFSVL